MIVPGAVAVQAGPASYVKKLHIVRGDNKSVTWTNPRPGLITTIYDVLIVGGGGGATAAGGGGGGGVVYTASSRTISSLRNDGLTTSLASSVGVGGAGKSDASDGGAGGSSSLGNQTSSGGGGAVFFTRGGNSGSGNAGGAFASSKGGVDAGGGGGGAASGATGGAGNSSTGTGGNGGSGVAVVTEFSAILSTGTNTVTLTSGDTNRILTGVTLTKVSGAGSFGAGATVSSITNNDTFVMSGNHASAGEIFFSVTRTYGGGGYGGSNTNGAPGGAQKGGAPMVMTGNGGNEAAGVLNGSAGAINFVWYGPSWTNPLTGA